MTLAKLCGSKSEIGYTKFPLEAGSDVLAAFRVSHFRLGRFVHLLIRIADSFLISPGKFHETQVLAEHQARNARSESRTAPWAIPDFQLSTNRGKPGIVESPINVANAILIAVNHLPPFFLIRKYRLLVTYCAPFVFTEPTPASICISSSYRSPGTARRRSSPFTNPLSDNW